MEISALTTAFSNTAAARGKSADADDQALGRARDLAVQQQAVASAKVTLSAEGETKSAVAGVQSAGKRLADVARAGNTGEVKSAALGLVQSYNKTIAAPKGAAETEKSRTDTNTGNELQQAAAAAANLPSFQQLGITANPNGTLNLDTTALENSLAANPTQTLGAAGRVGSTLQTAATRQLAASANTPATTNAPSPGESRNRDAQQAAQSDQAAAARRGEEEDARRRADAVKGGVAAYAKVLGS